MTNTSFSVSIKDYTFFIAHEYYLERKCDLLVTHREHVVALLVDLFLLLGDVELPEEVEGDDGVDVDDDGEQPHGEHELQEAQNYT